MSHAELVAAQRDSGDADFSDRNRWTFHYTRDPMVRYLRDRRLLVALKLLAKQDLIDESDCVLIVCGGVGGEGTFFANRGFQRVTVSDISPVALRACHDFDSRLDTLEINAEDMDLPDQSFDLVIVQDGLHHLPRPVAGLTEMLRVARKAAVVIEPHVGMVGNLIGTRWETHGDAVNFVFRWDRTMFEQVVRSYTVSDAVGVHTVRMWDHSTAAPRAASLVGAGASPAAIRGIYAALDCMRSWGNMFIGVADLRSWRRRLPT